MDHSAHSHGQDAAAIDPVCGMKVDPTQSAHRHAHDGHAYFFCSAKCLGKFIADPEKYLHTAAAKPTPDALLEGTIYTCPMHPQIRQDRSRRLPDLRHGARAGRRRPRKRCRTPN